jgi:hypothetical protein
MSNFLPVLGIAFAAFCVWLTVRIVNRHERWAKRLALGVAASYPISFIVLRLASIYGRFPMPRAAKNLYEPILWFQESIEGIIRILWR